MNFRQRLVCTVAIIISTTLSLHAQRNRSGGGGESAQADAEIQTAIALTRTGKFQEAIPHFLAARGTTKNPYAADFNLSLCYLGTGQYKKAIETLKSLRMGGSDTAEVENLLAQSLIGDGQLDDAFVAIQRSARIAPKNEKLYLFAADACMDGGYYELGAKVVELGLKSLPKSAPLVFQRAMFLSQMDRFDVARADFKRAQELAPGTDIAYIAGAQEALYAGNVKEAARVAREGIEKGNSHFLLLTIFGQAALDSGSVPGQPDFSLAQQALEKVVSEHPNFASAQLALGKLYLAADRTDDALGRLVAARKLDPSNPAVYSNLASAYKRRGDNENAHAALETLAKINREQVEKIGSTPGDRKAGYASGTPRNP